MTVTRVSLPWALCNCGYWCPFSPQNSSETGLHRYIPWGPAQSQCSINVSNKQMRIQSPSPRLHFLDRQLERGVPAPTSTRGSLRSGLRVRETIPVDISAILAVVPPGLSLSCGHTAEWTVLKTGLPLPLPLQEHRGRPTYSMSCLKDRNQGKKLSRECVFIILLLTDLTLILKSRSECIGFTMEGAGSACPQHLPVFQRALGIPT